MKNKKLVLMILDGWGYGREDVSNAILAAKTPFFDHLISAYPNSKLEASGEAVGLPAGQMGNSEVGHMNLGAGRIVDQELGRIHKAVQNGGLKSNSVLTNAFDYAKRENKQIHLIGLLSDGGVHSHIKHLYGLCDAAKEKQIEKLFIHAFLDGRDTDPNSGLGFISDLETYLSQTGGVLASVIGRYYAMDRDNRWERIKLAYDLMVHGTGKHVLDIKKAIQESYNEGITDEFIRPIVKVKGNGEVETVIRPGDVVICFNFRTDRGREITIALTQKAFPEYQLNPLPLHYITMTSYDDRYKNVQVVFQKDDLNETLGEVLEKNGRTQVRIAETEKYPHVTFFFSGGREKEFQGEKRIMIPSPKVATYDLQPEMSAKKVSEAICNELVSGKPDFVCLNFANPDMVGHTGVYDAVVKAVETVDHCAETVVKCGIENNYSFIIIADHGNAEYMVNEDGSSNTAHTINLVPCILIDKDYKAIKSGKLGDIAPTILKILDIPIPGKMDGTVLV